jgi:hypothetical protein
MDPISIINLLIILVPIAEKAGVQIYDLIEGIEDGKSVDDLIAECVVKRDDMPSLDFGQ